MKPARKERKGWSNWQRAAYREGSLSADRIAKLRTAGFNFEVGISSINNLAVCNPKLAKQWHSSKNGDLTPFDVLPNAHRSVWWKCDIGHEWEAKIDSRKPIRDGSYGCPFCTGKRFCIENSLGVKNPELAKEWHPSKNSCLSPFRVVPSSLKIVWWKCDNGHEWKQKICRRLNTRQTDVKYVGCRECKSLIYVNPLLAKEWDVLENGVLTVDVSAGSSKRVSWKCSLCGYKWVASIANRSNGRGCLNCSGKRKDFTTFEEARKYARSLKLESKKQWDDLCRNRKIRFDVPNDPFRFYRDEFIGYGDWLGTGQESPTNKKFMSYNEAKCLVQRLGIKNQKQWNSYRVSGSKPPDMPCNPAVTYTNRGGWIGWADFFGTTDGVEGGRSRRKAA